jgi:RNA polymerase sigma factor (sigma-70 family)
MEASARFQHTDELLSSRAAAGDRAAFDELYRRYSGPLAAYGARMLRDRGAGEDIAQTTFLNAFRALERGVEPRNVRPWLFKIAHNAALGSIRRERDVPVEFIDRPQQDDLEPRAARRSLIRGIGALPERQRRVYLLRELRGLTVSEIAVELELTSEQVEQALFSAKNKLAEQLSFGEPVTCDLVRSLTSVQLSKGEQRAVKAHVRSCLSCRAIRTKDGTAGTLGGGFLGLLERIGGFFATASGPIAAKVGAVAATAALGVAAGDPGIAHSVFDGGPSAAAASLQAAPVQAVPVALRLSPADVVPTFLKATARSSDWSAFSATGVGVHGLGNAAGNGRAPGSPGATAVPAVVDTTTDTTTDTTQDTNGDTNTDNSGDSSSDPAVSDTSGGSDLSADPASDPAATDPAATDPAADPAATDPAADPSADPTATDPAVDPLADTTPVDTTTVPLDQLPPDPTPVP